MVERCESPALWARDPQPSIEEIKHLRAEEMKEAADVLGTTIECLDFGDSPLLIGSQRRQQLLELFRKGRGYMEEACRDHFGGTPVGGSDLRKASGSGCACYFKSGYLENWPS